MWRSRAIALLWTGNWTDRADELGRKLLGRHDGRHGHEFVQRELRSRGSEERHRDAGRDRIWLFSISKWHSEWCIFRIGNESCLPSRECLFASAAYGTCFFAQGLHGVGWLERGGWPSGVNGTQNHEAVCIIWFMWGRCSQEVARVVKKGWSRRPRRCFQLRSLVIWGLILLIRRKSSRASSADLLPRSNTWRSRLPMEAIARIRDLIEDLEWSNCVLCVLPLCFAARLCPAKEGTARGSSGQAHCKGHVLGLGSNTNTNTNLDHQYISSSDTTLCTAPPPRWQQSHSVSRSKRFVRGDSHTCSPGPMDRTSA